MASKKNYRKFAASSLAATAAVAVAVPAVSANEHDVTEQFTDVAPGDDHYPGIQWIAERGVVGYEDGSFGAANDVTRPHAAIFLTRALGLELVSEDLVGDYFNDVDSGDLYADFIATVAANNVFKGSNGNFLPDQELTREQMASVIINAYGFTSADGEQVEINLDNVNDTHKESVQILANLGITNQLEDFRPTETINRSQFATFLYKAHLAAEASAPAPVVESVNAVSSTEIEVTFDGELTDEEIAELSFDFNPDLEVTKVERKAEEATLADTHATTTVVLTTEVQAADTQYTLEAVNGAVLEAPVVVEAPDTEAPVLAVDGETEISVENGAELTLPTVTATDNVDEEVEVTSEITDAEGNVLEEIDTTQAGTYTVTYTATDAAGNVAEEVVVTVEVAEAPPAVESVSAINATTVEVELNRELAEDEVLPTFTFDGEVVAEENISVDGSTVTLSGLSLEDDSVNPDGYNLTVVGEGEEELYNDTVVYDANELESLSTETVSPINAVVGEEVSVTYTLKDEDGDPIAGEDVRVRANFNGNVVEEQVLTSDENGEVTFTYSEVDGGAHNVSAVALSQPTLRDSSVNIDWVETGATVSIENPEKDGFLTSNTANVDQETQTIKYVATFTDEDGNPLPDGETVYVNIDGLTNFNGLNDNEFASVGQSTELYSATLDNGDGTAVLEFETTTVDTLAPTFYQDADQAGIQTIQDFESTDARLKAKNVEVLDSAAQEANFTLELKEGEDVNETVAVDGTTQVEQGDTVEYLLTATDQYGNPYTGTASVANETDLDDIASNDGNEGNIQVDYDEVDSGYTNTDVQTVDFANDTNGDGQVELQVSAGQDGDVSNLVIWQDKDNDGDVDTDEASVETGTIEYVAPSTDVIQTLTSSVSDDSVFGGTPVTFTYNLLNQNENAFDANADNTDVIIKVYKDGEELTPAEADSYLSNFTGIVDVNGDGATTPDTAVGTDGVTATVNAADGEFTFDVTPVVNQDEGSNFSTEVYVDVNGDGEVQSDETLNQQSEAFNTVTRPETYNVTIADTEVVAGENVSMTVTAVDGNGDTVTDFNGTYVATIKFADDTANAGEQYLRNATFVNGVATVEAPVSSVENDDVQVTLPVGNTPTVDVGTATDNDLTITASNASELSSEDLNADGVVEELYVSDEYGNIVDYDFSGLATVSIDGDATLQQEDGGAVTLDSENQISLTITDGILTVDGERVTLVDGGDGETDTLTVTLNNGDSFSN
ncbi:S-layer homology domain-containing protein [Virgibacillus sediminis]|uniref:S-layer homology domain-containing protein n=1 Tax=Virgibacillus sediminis TaxID=202260 RepID=A0ABV7A3P7_9BACI